MIEIRKITPEISIGLLDLAAFSIARNIELKREQEKAGARFVLEKLLGTNMFELAYTAQNKPYLKNNTGHISISHSHNKLVIILNRAANTGIDIELIRDKILRVRHKFLNDHETAFAKDDIEKLIAIWATKEAMYKYYGLKEVDFKKHLSVKDFDSDIIFGKIELSDLKKNFQLVKEKIEDYMMIYILKEVA